MPEPIPPGYQLHVVSWENDADAYGTKIISGLTKEDVEFLLSIVKRFESHSWHRGGLGNQGNSNSTLVKVIMQARDDHPGISCDLRMHWTLELPEFDDIDELHDDDLDSAGCQACDLIYELLGSPVDPYFYDTINFCRVFESFKVYKFDVQVPEVTLQFK
jgi:hypothetical protein